MRLVTELKYYGAILCYAFLNTATHIIFPTFDCDRWHPFRESTTTSRRPKPWPTNRLSPSQFSIMEWSQRKKPTTPSQTDEAERKRGQKEGSRKNHQHGYHKDEQREVAQGQVRGKDKPCRAPETYRQGNWNATDPQQCRCRVRPHSSSVLPMQGPTTLPGKPWPAKDYRLHSRDADRVQQQDPALAPTPQDLPSVQSPEESGHRSTPLSRSCRCRRTERIRIKQHYPALYYTLTSRPFTRLQERHTAQQASSNDMAGNRVKPNKINYKVTTEIQLPRLPNTIVYLSYSKKYQK